MARATPKRSLNGGKPPKTADISNFFRKTPSDQSEVPRKASRGTVLEDIKPNVSVKAANGRSRKGKEKAVGGDSSADPVVISSDEEDALVRSTEARAKRQRTVQSPVPALPCSPGAGPSRSRSPLPTNACSPASKTFGPSPPPSVPSDPPRPVFAGAPDFQPPPTWPNIINTASNPLEDMEDDDEGVVDVGGDTDSQHPGMFEEDDNATQDPGDDRDDPEVDDSGVDMGVEEIPPERPEPDSDLELAGGPRRKSIDLTMEWDEGDDEGMGMEEPDDCDDPPSKTGRVADTNRTNGDPSDKCPVCSASIKGKTKTVSKHNSRHGRNQT